MIIRKPLPRALGLNEPLRHQDHPRPRTRREFISQGFMTGSAMAFIPSTLGFLLANPRVANALSDDMAALKAACNINNGAGRVPFICFDLSGGANIAGSNVLVGQSGDQMNFLSTAGYSKLGLPGTMIPNAGAAGTNFIDTRLGLAFHSDSAFLRGMMTRISATTAANINGCVIPALSNNDTNTNPHNPLYSIAKTGSRGSLLVLAGTDNSVSGGNSVAPAMTIDLSIQPTKINSATDLTSLVPSGSGPSIFNGPTAQRDMVATLESMERTTKEKLDAITLLSSGDAAAKQQVQCNYVKNANTAEIFSGPDTLDPNKDLNITGAATSIFTAAELQSRDFMQTASIMKLIANGFGGAAVNQLGGFDYHTGDRMTGETRDFNAGVCMGASLEYAARVGQPLMLYVFSDGSLQSSGMIDNSTGGRGKGVWTNDNQSTAASFMLVYSPKGRPVVARNQIGSYQASGDIAAASSPAANSVNQLVEVVVANYMALHGEEGNYQTLFPTTGLSTAQLSSVLAFSKIT